eukprot:16310435-Heterocapsa_arctica.AAC.1
MGCIDPGATSSSTPTPPSTPSPSKPLLSQEAVAALGGVPPLPGQARGSNSEGPKTHLPTPQSGTSSEAG